LPRPERTVFLYALSTCAWCKKTIAWLNDHKVEYRHVFVDLLGGEERERTLAEMARHTPRVAYPILVIDGGTAVIQGYQPERMQEELE
jgi:glutaredoxin-like protein NrdH